MKHVKRLILFFVILLSLYLILKQFFLSTIVGWLTTYVKLGTISISDFLSVVSGILSVVIAFIFDYYLSCREERINKQQEAPYINICTAREQPITGKRSLRNNRYFQIELGKPQEEFRYVYSQIINTGKSTIINCFVANKRFPQQIKPQTEYPVCFLVYEPLKPKSRRKYFIKYQIEDGKGGKYKGTYILKIDIDRREAAFYIKKKQKEL